MAEKNSAQSMEAGVRGFKTTFHFLATCALNLHSHVYPLTHANALEKQNNRSIPNSNGTFPAEHCQKAKNGLNK